MMADVWHTFSIHFLDMKLTKTCLFAELVIKLVCWLTRLRHNNIYYHTNITVASHVHKITGNLTICSIVCSVIDKEKKTNYTMLVFFRQIPRLSPVALTNKGQQSGQRPMILQPARAFSTLFFNILTTLDYFLQSKTIWFKSRHAFVLLTSPHSVLRRHFNHGAP